MQRIAAHEGGYTDTTRDYEYTDWAALEGLVEELFAAGLVQPLKRADSCHGQP
jgi:hypothetical protein